MLKNQRLLLAACAGLLVTVSSCNTNVFDEEDYKKIVSYLSPVDSVDQSHTWKMDTVYQLRVAADVSIGASELLILSGNPAAGNAEVLANRSISDGETVSVSFSAPLLSTAFYAALRNSNGQYLVIPFAAGKSELQFSEANQSPVSIYAKLGTQTYTYCFDESFPVPEDYDFNDVVLRLAYERSGDRQLTVKVTLAAVGGDKQLGAAIRLVGYQYDDIESVITAGDVIFNNDIPSTSVNLIEDFNLLTRGRQGEAVVALFQDAHWAIDNRQGVEYGMFTRKKYNVSAGTSGNFQQMAPRTVTYIINVKDATKLNDFTFRSFDPFILEDYNGAVWEVHTNEHMLAQTLYEYPATAIKNLPWALCIPKGDFRYPLEGVNMGFKKRDATFGAYMTPSHSFGDWSEDHLTALDWYNYPTLNQVY